MKLYRINKLSRAVIKKRDMLASGDQQALREAQNSDDCPICDVFRDGEKVGQVY